MESARSWHWKPTLAGLKRSVSSRKYSVTMEEATMGSWGGGGAGRAHCPPQPPQVPFAASWGLQGGGPSRVPHPPDPASFLSWWQLEEKAELNEHVQVLPFQREDREVAADTLCAVAGWGTVTHSGMRPDRLQEVQRPVISRELCNHRTRHDRTITEKMMCTDSRKKDTCKGDSGGPLVCNGVAEGVVTAGSRVCGNYKKPAIYTRIAPYAEWIDSIMASRDGDTDEDVARR
uniref:Peptidase S1 domain-containing protein n=1 Tax=Pavo cristatus TaxID=9049 RepID=A0A8C9FAS4_PAVCR